MDAPVVIRARRLLGAAAVVLAGFGAAAVVLGILALVRPAAAVPVLGLAFALWLAATGLARLVLAAQVRSWPRWYRAATALLGVLLLATALAALFALTWSAQLLALVVGLGFLAAAVVDLALGMSSRWGRAGSVGLGVLHALVAVLFLAHPDAGLTLVTVALGVVLVLAGPPAVVAGLTLGAWARGLRSDPQDPGPGGIRVIEAEIL